MRIFTRSIRRLLPGLVLLAMSQAVWSQDAGQPARDGDFQSGGPGSPPIVGGQPTPKPSPGPGGPTAGGGGPKGPSTSTGGQTGPVTPPTTAGGTGTVTGGPGGPGSGGTGPVARGGDGTRIPPPTVSTGGPAGLPGAAASQAPPPQLTVGKNTKILRWTTFRKITAFPRGEGAQMISNVKMAADGSRIAFISRKGTFVINPDGKDQRQLSDKPASLVDISSDGRTVAWFQPDDEKIFVSGTGGGEKTEMPPGLKRILSLRLTADGSRLFALSPEKGGIFMMPTDASDVRKVVTTADVCKLFALDENGNFWRTFDISDDGSHLVGHLLANAFAANGDGSGLRALTKYKSEGMLWSVRISGDGGTIVHFRQNPDNIAYVFSNWDGGNVRELRRPAEETPASMHVSRDGRSAAVTRGTRFVHADGRTYFDASEIGTSFWANPYNLTMTGRHAAGVPANRRAGIHRPGPAQPTCNR